MISNQIHSVPPPQTTNTMNQQQQQQQQQQPLYSNGNGSSNSPLNGYTTVGLGGDFISNNVNIGDINNVDMYNRKRKAETEQIIEQHYQLQDQQLQSQPPLPQLLPTQTQTQIQTPTQTPPLLQQPQQQQQQTIQQAKPTTPQSSSPTPPNVDNATINAPDSKREKPTEIEKIVIYTDGACRRNPGPGSWGCLIFEGDNIKTLDEQTAKSLCGGEVKTTNNRMELMAVIQGLEYLGKAEKKNAFIYTDSKYVQQGITLWIQKWIDNSWRTSSKKPVKNDDLWKTLHQLNQLHQINWNWVKGHSDNKLNNAVDKICNKYLDERFPETIRKK